jgi:hypothetical protein
LNVSPAMFSGGRVKREADIAKQEQGNDCINDSW